MIREYKEIFYGVLFGLGAGVIDVFMHASIEKREFSDEMFRFEPGVLVYRILFLGFGLALGALLWRNSRRERDYRQLERTLARIEKELAPLLTMMHAELQVLLTGNDLRSFPQAEAAVRLLYEQTQKAKSAARLEYTAQE